MASYSATQDPAQHVCTLVCVLYTGLHTAYMPAGLLVIFLSARTVIVCQATRTTQIFVLPKHKNVLVPTFKLSVIKMWSYQK